MTTHEHVDRNQAFFSSYTGRMLFGMLIIHTILVPLVFVGMLLLLQHDYQSQFVNNARLVLSTNINEVHDMAVALEHMRSKLVAREREIALHAARQSAVLETADEGSLLWMINVLSKA